MIFKNMYVCNNRENKYITTLNTAPSCAEYQYIYLVSFLTAPSTSCVKGNKCLKAPLVIHKVLQMVPDVLNPNLQSIAIGGMNIIANG